MKGLLDQDLPHAVRRELSGHDYFTAAYTLEAIRPLYPALIEVLSNLQPREFVKLARTP